MAIQGVESDHGRDVEHRTIASEDSIHFGESAIGNWAMMPNTVRMLKKDVNRFREDPIYQKMVVKEYAIKVLQSSRGCPLTASVLWLKGAGAKPIPADFQTARFKRFVQEWEAVSGFPIEQDPIIKRYCL